eukprot:GEMP01083175.1.p2 GENE.GEMP01083175.1~~GEMP01083175.1.p2  ORF type:complete len:251 (+),score=72.32 GEMP01083175.1:30-755(+)
MKLEGRHFLVSGGASGLGHGAAKALVAKGAKVTILDRDEDRGKEVAQSLGANAHFTVCDVTDHGSIAKALDSLHFPQVHGLVNCAGTGLSISSVNKKGVMHDMESFEWLVKLNLTGNFSLACKAALKMTKNEPVDGERGAIVNVASVAAFDGQNGQCAYSATKGGIAAMTLPMARDLGRYGIRVNCVAPGVFDTAMTVGMDGSYVGNALKKQQVFPNARFGKAEEEFGHTVVEGGTTSPMF